MFLHWSVCTSHWHTQLWWWCKGPLFGTSCKLWKERSAGGARERDWLPTSVGEKFAQCSPIPVGVLVIMWYTGHNVWCQSCQPPVCVLHILAMFLRILQRFCVPLNFQHSTWTFEVHVLRMCMHVQCTCSTVSVFLSGHFTIFKYPYDSHRFP